MRLLVLLVFFCHLCFCFVYAAEETIGIKEGEFAKLFSTVLGIDQELPDDAKQQEFLELLTHYGIAPLDGWSVDRPLTLGRLATILLRAKNIKHVRINDSEECLSNIANINREWFIKYKNEKRWGTLSSIVSEARKCPFGKSYEDANNDYLVDRHIHPDIDKAEEAYREILINNAVPISRGKIDEIVSLSQAKELLRSFSGNNVALRPYLTPATPILPKDIETVEAPTGYLIFAVYENGSAIKVLWRPTWASGASVEIVVVYAHDASLAGNRSIKIFINGIEADSSAEQWTQDLTPDENIWIGVQSQTGKFPSNATLYNLETFSTTDIKKILTSEEKPVFSSRLDSASAVNSPRRGLGGRFLGGVSNKEQDFFQNRGFLPESEGEYLLFPVANLNHFKGGFRITVSPRFVSSEQEHAFLSTVNWSAKGGADGFYLYYMSDPKRR